MFKNVLHIVDWKDYLTVRLEYPEVQKKKLIIIMI